MKTIIKLSTLLTLVVLIMNGCKEVEKNTTDNWAMLDFVKVDSINPFMKPDSTQVFDCPISKKKSALGRKKCAQSISHR